MEIIQKEHIQPDNKHRVRIVFRTDASEQIGSGHWMRCLVLADLLLQDESNEVHFISRKLIGNLHYMLDDKNPIILHKLPSYQHISGLDDYEKWLTVPQEIDADETVQVIRGMGYIDYIIVDSYSLDIVWERKVRPWVKKIFVIDDMANRKHDCDIIMDQNCNFVNDYRFYKNVPFDCKILLGAKYLLLRKEFYKVKIRKRMGKPQRIFVFYGSSDSTNETMKAIKALECEKFINIKKTILVGVNNKYRDKIENECMARGYDYFCQVDNISVLMNEADLFIGAGGGTIWERCYLGVPAIVTSVAENQTVFCRQYHRMGFMYYIGAHYEVTVEILRNAIQRMIDDFDLRNNIIRCGWNLHIGEYYKNWGGLNEL